MQFFFQFKKQKQKQTQFIKVILDNFWYKSEHSLQVQHCGRKVSKEKNQPPKPTKQVQHIRPELSFPNS